jgi:NAD(P)-dependent dehydrogenase (short-subunit alcohol dehydrogenase family)
VTSTVFITGADRGLGKAFVDQFLAQGWRVFAGCFEQALLGEPARDVSSAHTEVPLDVRSSSSVMAARAVVAERSQRLEMLINNAGINPDKYIPLEQLDFDMLHGVIDVNALGPLRMAQQLLSLLENGTKKTIVNISSEAGSLAACTRDSWFGYCMSKAALNMQTRILQNYLGPRGFRVFAVHPGWIRTAMTSGDAPMLPEESASRIYSLVVDPKPETPMYVQYDGTGYPW